MDGRTSSNIVSSPAPLCCTLSCIAIDVVHECAIVRRGLTSMLSQVAGIDSTREVQDAAAYLKIPLGDRSPIAYVSPLVATELQDSGALGQTTAEAHSAALIVIACAFGDLDARELLQRGVMGLLLLSADPGELLIAARRVTLGGRYVTPSVATRVAEGAYADALTLRENQILEYLSEGRCNKTIANELGIALGTVKTHVKAIFAKLAVSSRTQAVVVASRRGIVRHASA